jgi:hypothetical protein
MIDFREQRTCVKFCFKLGKTATECYEMLKTAFGEQAMGRSQTFRCHKILTEDLKMRHVASLFVPILLNVDQKQQ